MNEIARYSMHINSAYRTSGTNTDFTIQLSQVINLLAKHSMLEVVVHAITIPFSFYQLSSDIQTVAIRVTNGASVYNSTISLTPGNYNVNTVLTELQTKVSAYIFFVTGITPTLTFSYDSITCKSTLAISNTMTIILFFSNNTSLGAFFGFSANATFSNASSATSTKIAVANPVNTLYLRSPSLRQFKNREWLTESDVFSDILYRIPIYTNQNTYIIQNEDSEPTYIVNNSITAINFYLTTNLSYTAINLQGLDFSFHFTIIERELKQFAPIQDSLLVNIASPVEKTDEVKALENERDKVLQKIDKYKRKLPELQ